jgi:hypothetical protein
MVTKFLPHLKKQYKELKPPGFLVVFICSFLIIGVKNGFEGIFYPLLYNEDAGNIFKTFLGEHRFHHIFSVYASYIRIFPNLIGYILSFFPLPVTLLFYCLISLCMTALAYSIFYIVLDHFFNDKWFSVISALMISALPLGSFQMVEVLMYQIWHSTLILFLLILIPLPKNLLPKICIAICAHILIWTHPYSIMVMPLLLWNIFIRKEFQWIQASFVISALLYYFIAVDRQPIHIESLTNLIPNLLSRVVTESIIGPNSRVFLQYMGGVYIFAILVLIFLIIVFLSTWKNWKKEQIYFFGVCIYLIMIPMIAALVSRDLGDYYHLLRGSPRYVYLPKIFFLVMVFIALRELIKKYAGVKKWWLALAVLTLIINSNSNILYKTNTNTDRKTLRLEGHQLSGTVPCRSGEEKIVYRGKGQWVLPINLCSY